MEAKIQNQIIDYFSFFEEFYNIAKDRLKDCQNCAAAINRLIKRYKNVKQSELIGTPLEEFEGLQNRLCASILNLISKEVEGIRRSLQKLEELFGNLCLKNKVLRESCREVDFNTATPLVKGSPLQPPLKQLLEFAADTITFGAQVCALLDTSLNVLTLKGTDSDSLVDNFRISSNWRHRIPEIISYTSFCSENQV